MIVWADHGAQRDREPIGIFLRPRNAESNMAADHIEATGLASAAPPVLARADSGDMHEVLRWLAVRWLHYSVGVTSTEDMRGAILKVLTAVWTSAAAATGRVCYPIAACPIFRAYLLT
jgi:hypothetical protein